MAKIPVREEPIRNLEYQIGSGLVQIGSYLYPVFVQKGGGTPTIINVTTSDANWTALTTGQTSILSWRVSERAGSDFYLAFEAAPTTYITVFGVMQDNTEITNIYIKRTGTANITVELLIWKK